MHSTLLATVTAIAALAFAAPIAAAPLGSSITYQGVLNQTGAPFTGTIDVRGTLFDAVTGGAAVGAVSTVTGVAVSDGVFSVEFDFGAGVFGTQQRWLQIEVRPSGGGSYTALSPRQKVTAAPQALGPWQLAGGHAVFNSGNVGIGTQNPSAAQLVVDGSTSTIPALSISSPGQSSGTILISSPAATTGILSYANNGNRRDIRFADDGLALVTNSTASMPNAANGIFIDEQGEVGIGTTTPGARLEVVGNSLFSGFLLTTNQIFADGLIASGDKVYGDEFEYNIPQEHVVSIHASAFTTDTNINYFNDAVFLVETDSPSRVTAPVSLPNGARIVRAELYGSRTNIGFGQIKLERYGFTGGRQAILTSSAPGASNSNVAIPLEPSAADSGWYVVDNTQWAYAVNTIIGSDSGSRKIQAVAIWYTVAGPQ